MMKLWRRRPAGSVDGAERWTWIMRHLRSWSRPRVALVGRGVAETNETKNQISLSLKGAILRNRLDAMTSRTGQEDNTLTHCTTVYCSLSLSLSLTFDSCFAATSDHRHIVFVLDCSSLWLTGPVLQPHTWAPKRSHHKTRPPAPDASGAGAQSSGDDAMRHELSYILGGEVGRDDGSVAGIGMGAPRIAGLVAGLDLDLRQDGKQITRLRLNACTTKPCTHQLSELPIDNDLYRELGSAHHGAALLGSDQG